MNIKLVRKDNVIKTRFILNPFLWFSLVWIFVLFIHTFNFSKAYPSTSSSMYAFFGFIIPCSIILAIFYHFKFLKKMKHIHISSRPLFSVVIFCYVALALECVYSRSIPLISIFRHDINYLSFGIPLLTGLFSSFTMFISVICSIKLVYCKENRFKNFILLLLTYGRYVIVFSRGPLIFCVLITLIIFFSKRKFSFWWIPILIILGIAFLFVFNITGNIRMGFAWNDSSYLLEISKFDKKYYGLQNFSWGLVYLDTPLGNILYNEAHYVYPNDINGLISQLLPNIVSEVIYPDYDRALRLVIPNLNVSSIFAGGYKFYGYSGMMATYIELVLVILICSWLCKKDNASLVGCSSFLVLICAMSFFDNILILAGYTFVLLYLIVYALAYARKKKYFNFNVLVLNS